MPGSAIASVPFGGILDRYLMRGFMRIFVLSLLCTTMLYLIVDFFDRIDKLLQAGAPLGTSLRYFLYKLPLLISRVFGFAALFSTLFSLGMLSRTHEITAMRASGLSLRRLTFPLLLLSVAIALFIFFWNEALVPIFTRESQTIYQVEVRKKQPKNLIGAKELWIRGEDSFVSVDSFNAKRNTLEGVVIYLLDQDFGLRGVIEAPWARWDGNRWEARGATEWLFRPEGQILHQKAVAHLPLTETPEDLKIFAREPEELGFFELKKQIADLKAKGIDTSEHQVDLHIKLALPLISPLMVFLAIPFALRQGSRGGIALSFGLTLLIGFGYWVMLGFSTALGYTATFPPWVAAWLPNTTLLLVGLLFSLEKE